MNEDLGESSNLEAPSRKFVVVASTNTTNQGEELENTPEPNDPFSSVKSLGSFRLHFRTGNNTVKEPVPKSVTFRQSVYEIQEEHFAFDGDGIPNYYKQQAEAVAYIAQDLNTYTQPPVYRSSDYEENKETDDVSTTLSQDQPEIDTIMEGPPSSTIDNEIQSLPMDDGRGWGEDEVVIHIPMEGDQKEFEDGHETANDTQSDNEETEGPKDDEESFHFFLPEEEPVLTPDFQERAIRSVGSTVFDVPSPTSHTATKYKANCEGCCTFDLCASKNSKTPNLSPETHTASKQGLTMIKKLLNPALPKILVDLWVIFELAITITQFVLAVASISLDHQQAFNILYLVLATLGLAFALLDSFIHFIQLGSCVAIIKYIRKSKKRNKESEDRTDSSRSNKNCCKISNPKRWQQVGEVIDLVRNIITEIILYPLIILDLFDIITSRSIFGSTAGDRVNLSLFVIGAIFLVLSVYVVRVIMIATAGVSLRRVPLDASHSQKQSIKMFSWFLVHILAQILVNGSIIISIGMNIYLEDTPGLFNLKTDPGLFNLTTNPVPTPAGNTDTLNASPFLIYSIVAGLFITPFGVASFFIVNYYQIRELSVSFWVDMMSLLQSESFAGLIFKGEGVKVAKKKAKGFAEKIKLKNVKDDLKKIKSAPLLIKLLYPFRIPVFVVLGVVYFALLLSFLATLSIVCSPTVSGIPTCQTYSFFTNPTLFSIPYFFTFSLVVLANAHVVLLVSFWLLIVLSVALFIVLLPVVLVLYILLYIPLGSIACCLTLVGDVGSEMNVLPRTAGERAERYRTHKASVRKVFLGENLESK